MSSAMSLVACYALNAVWQVPLFAGAGFVASRILRRWGPQPQHAAWVATLLLSSLTPALAALRVPVAFANSFGQASPTGHPSIILSGSNFAGAVRAGTVLLPSGILWLICCLYGLTFLYFAARLLSSNAAAKTLVRNAAPLNLAGRETIWEQVRIAFAACDIPLLSSERVRGILTTGWRSPVIILPADAAIQWTEHDLLSALGHEMAHVRRCDCAKNLLYEMAGLLTAFHPVTWIVKARIAQTREMICDAMVVERLVDRKRYRQSLLLLAERMVGSRAALHALGMFDGNILEERIMMMRSKRTVTNRWVRGGMTASVTALLIAAVIGGTAFAKGVATPMAEHSASPDKVYKPGPGISMPTLKFAPDPQFPKVAIVDNAICVVGLVVDREGMPGDVHVIRSAGREFDANAQNAVRRYRFNPALRHGHPVAVAINIEVNFRRH